jgi:hypothetical protein
MKRRKDAGAASGRPHPAAAPAEALDYKSTGRTVARPLPCVRAIAASRMP